VLVIIFSSLFFNYIIIKKKNKRYEVGSIEKERVKFWKGAQKVWEDRLKHISKVFFYDLIVFSLLFVLEIRKSVILF
jgi:hypothetical protein